MRALIPTLVAAICLLALPFAQAGKVYRWVDAHGVAHYGDHAPATATAPRAHVRVSNVADASDPSPIAVLRRASSGSGIQAIAENRLAGPVEVRLAFSRDNNMRADPDLPVSTTVPASRRSVIAYLEALDPAQPGDFELTMDAVPGDPRARPQDVEYLLPLRMRGWHIEQGFGGSFSHDDEQNRYAIDLAAPIGTPVLAARDGVVMQVESDFARAGLDRERYAGRANLIRILHDDGTMAMYAHLKAEGVLVRLGQRVQAGQVIGLSGNTGFTSGPHLHFSVQANRGMRLESIRFRMRGPQGPLNLGGI
ncbi:peptidoglycan DD-metalloendopeptidase family protein [Cognatilysobacter lacus]|uniref:M23 family metallopeptidase n=1 Tax=Cognatilysobacter lacus TaxID=1643323 RepID=A0A5D8ZB19_9GAMM|nr:M23 family metallopeptidase [Lysobacter lacus]TZF91746.1 M23 family metallopeptidase [Lysobacter lacus]